MPDDSFRDYAAIAQDTSIRVISAPRKLLQVSYVTGDVHVVFRHRYYADAKKIRIESKCPPFRVARSGLKVVVALLGGPKNTLFSSDIEL
jgi:hypothetical protein